MMNILKIISERELDERILSGLQRQSLTCSEQNIPTEKRTGYKQSTFSSDTLKTSGTVILTLKSCSDEEGTSLVKTFCSDDTPYVCLPISMLDENDNTGNKTVSNRNDFHFEVFEIINATRKFAEKDGEGKVILRPNKQISARDGGTAPGDNPVKCNVYLHIFFQPNVFLTARNATTVKETVRILKKIVDSKKVDIKPFHLSTSDDEERLREELHSHRPCKVLCCVDNSARNIILSPTEPDEASNIVDAAKDVCGKNGVFLLLRGHRGVRDDELYDERQFSTTFLGRQPKLQELVEADQFASVYSDLNKKQERAILDWIFRQPDNPTSTVKHRSDSIKQCVPVDGNSVENVSRNRISDYLSGLLTRGWFNRSRQPANKIPCKMETQIEIETQMNKTSNIKE